MKFPLVRRKAHDELERTLRMVNRALEHELAEKIRLEKKLILANAKALEEQGRADHFQKRCEAYEDAAAREGKQFSKAVDEENFYALVPSTKYKRV